MEITKLQLSYEKTNNGDKAFPCIIVAGGSSSRMNGINKQLLKIGDVPVIVKTLLKFNNSKKIKNIILVTKESDIPVYQNLCNDYGIEKVSDIVNGGNNRHESVMNGIKMLDTDDDFVLIHDGARPFVTEKNINDVCEALSFCDCALVALKATDTVKLTDGEMTVLDTLDREKIYLAQTPQGVNVQKYKSACEKSEGGSFTDDASIMEKAGYKTIVLDGDKKNIKITSPDDIAIAEVFAKIEEENK